MEWLAGTVVGFIFLTILVVILARRSTERWERDRRAASERRRAHLLGAPAFRRGRADSRAGRRVRLGGRLRTPIESVRQAIDSSPQPPPEAHAPVRQVLGTLWTVGRSRVVRRRRR